jgi:hypothetical protein
MTTLRVVNLFLVHSLRPLLLDIRAAYPRLLGQLLSSCEPNQVCLLLMGWKEKKCTLVLDQEEEEQIR